jgi:hypothetical protein
MDNIHIITYATHDEGNFKNLINNKFNINVKVLGWGKKWNGFMDKLKNMYEYISTLPDNDIVLFIDGFDTTINNSLENIKQKFVDFNSNIVLSEDIYLPFSKKTFGTCKKKLIANAGLYAGYNKKLQDLINYILSENYSEDDQRNMNHACLHFKKWIKIDTEKTLFHNQGHYERYFNNKSNSCFISTPGKLSYNRIKRVPGEYFHFVWKELLLILLILIVIYYCVKYKGKYNIFKTPFKKGSMSSVYKK